MSLVIKWVKMISSLEKTWNSSRRILILFWVIPFLFLMTASLQAVEEFPRPVGAVSDFAGVIPDQYKVQMEALSREVLEKTGTSVVVATVKSLGNSDVEDYANRLYQEWKIGKKGEDKGVLIFLAVAERKIRIETGYGVEGMLPDGLVGEILDQYAIPNLKQNDYGKGLAGAMAGVSAVVAKDAGVSLTGQPSDSRPKRSVGKQGGSIIPIILLILIMIPLLGTRKGREMLPWLLLLFLSSGGRGSGGFGGFGGGGFGGFGGGMSGGGGASRDF